MSLKNWIKEANDRLQPYYLFITMILFFITSIGTIGRHFSNKRSDIIVSVRYDSMEYPSSINNKYLSVYNSILQSRDSTINRKDADQVRKYLTQTQSIKHISIKNNRKRIISDVTFRDCSVSTLTAYGNSSTFKLPEEGASLLKRMKYDAKSNIAYLEEPITLFPNEEFHITLWGSFNSFGEHDNIFVNYEGRTARVITSKEFSGFAAIAADYYMFFFIILFLVFSIVFYHSVTRKKND